MANPKRHIFIMGAGIAGLTLALTLAKFNIRVTVLEKTDKPQTQGAGIQISPNARAILNQMGLDSALRAAAFEPKGIHLYPFRRPEPLVEFKLGALAEKRFDAAYSVIHRADLLDILVRACQKVPQIEIIFGVDSCDVERHERGLSLLYQTRKGEVAGAEAFALVGADGVHSMVRRAHLDGENAKYSGMVAWRTLIPFSHAMEKFSAQHTTLLWGPGFHGVIYPLPNKQLFNIALFTKRALKLIETGDDELSLPKPLYRSPEFKLLLDNASHGWTHWPLYTVKAAKWHEDDIGLLGDAAHAMLPFQAQGAAMAIEDAAVLGQSLAGSAKASEGFEQFEHLRRKRVEKVATTSWRNGMTFHLEWPFNLPRDLVVANTNPNKHFERLAWIYDYQAPKLDTQNEIRLRKANSQDALNLAKIFTASRRTIPGLPLLHTAEEDFGFVSNEIIPKLEVTLAHSHERIVGFIATSPEPAEGQNSENRQMIEHLYIAPEWRGHGVGTKLLNHAKAKAKSSLGLWVFQTNERARDFYAFHGFACEKMTDGQDNEEKMPDVFYVWHR